MSILIFGGAGFVGRHYVEYFLNKNKSVEVIDNIAPLSGGVHPKKWKLLAVSSNGVIAAIANEENNRFATQFHPEVSQTENGKTNRKNLQQKGLYLECLGNQTKQKKFCLQP